MLLAAEPAHGLTRCMLIALLFWLRGGGAAWPCLPQTVSGGSRAGVCRPRLWCGALPAVCLCWWSGAWRAAICSAQPHGCACSRHAATSQRLVMAASRVCLLVPLFPLSCSVHACKHHWLLHKPAVACPAWGQQAQGCARQRIHQHVRTACWVPHLACMEAVRCKLQTRQRIAMASPCARASVHWLHCFGCQSSSGCLAVFRPGRIDCRGADRKPYSTHTGPPPPPSASRQQPVHRQPDGQRAVVQEGCQLLGRPPGRHVELVPLEKGFPRSAVLPRSRANHADRDVLAHHAVNAAVRHCCRACCPARGSRGWCPWCLQCLLPAAAWIPGMPDPF